MANELLQNTILPSVGENIVKNITPQTAEKTTPTGQFSVPQTYESDAMKATVVGKPVIQPTIISADQAKTDLNKKTEEINQVSNSIAQKNGTTPVAVNLKDIAIQKGVESDFKSLESLANKYGISNYIGSPEQNTKLAELLKNQPVVEKKPEDKLIEAMAETTKTDTTTPTTTETTTPTKTETDLASIYDKQDQAYQDYKSSIAKIEKGEIPLTTEEQSQLNEINRTFDELRSSQIEANKSFENTIKIAGARYGGRYTPEGESVLLKKSINDGIKKVQGIDSKRLSTISEFKQAIKDKNYKQANDAYTAFRQYSQDKASALKDIYTIAKNEQDRVDKIKKETQDYVLELQKEQNKLDLENTKQINEIVKEVSKNGAPIDVIQKIQSSGNVGEAYSLAGNYLQSGTGIVGEYLFYKRQAEASGQTPVDFNSYQNIDANRKAKVAAAANASGLDNQTLGKVLSIADDIKNDLTTKSYIAANEGYQTIKTIGTDTKNPADDINFIYSFAKIMDPNSVVREGEYATIQKYAQSWAQAFGFKASRIFSNTNFLSKDAKEKMLNTLEPKMKTLEKAYKNTYNETVNKINKITKKGDGSEYVTDYSKAWQENMDEANKQAMSDEEAKTKITSWVNASNDNRKRLEEYMKIAPNATPSEALQDLGIQ